MSSDFVRYSPVIETIDPHIDELMAPIIEFWEKKGREICSSTLFLHAGGRTRPSGSAGASSPIVQSICCGVSL